jgi:hypothetical protein
MMSENEVSRITLVLRVAGSEYFCHEKIPVSQGLSDTECPRRAP